MAVQTPFEGVMAIDKKADDLLGELVRGKTQAEVFGEGGC